MKNLFLILIVLIAAQTGFGQNLENGWYFLDKYSWEAPISKEDAFKSLEKHNLIIPVSHFDKLYLSKSKTRPFNQLYIIFDEKGKEIWHKATSESIGKSFCFVLDDKIISIVYITSTISNGKSSIGGEKSNLKKLKNNLEKELK